MRKKLLAGLAVGVMMLVVSGVAEATQILYIFSGSIGSVDPELQGTFATGGNASIHIEIDSETPNSSGTSDWGRYGGNSVSGDIGGYAFTGGGFVDVFNNKDIDNSDQIHFSMDNLNGLPVGGYALNSGRVQLYDSTKLSLADNGLPTALSIDEFDYKPWYLFFQVPDPQGNTIEVKSVQINLTDIQIHTDPVPEPATMLLMGTGLAGLIGARRKKKA